MIDLITRLETMADFYYKHGRDIEAAICYEALAKAYAEQGAKAAQMRIVSTAKANTLRKYQAPPPVNQPKDHTFTITDGASQ